jgi:uncharacterized protein
MITNDIKMIVEKSMLCFVATVNTNGSPNVSPKSTLKVYDDKHLIFANIASPNTIKNIQRDPRIEINCVDVFLRRGYRFKGTASVYNGTSPIFLELVRSIEIEHGKEIPVSDAILINISEIKPILSPAYTFIDGIKEDDLKISYKAKYEAMLVDNEE